MRHSSSGPSAIRMMLVQLKWSALASSSHSQTGTDWAEVRACNFISTHQPSRCRDSTNEISSDVNLLNSHMSPSIFGFALLCLQRGRYRKRRLTKHIAASQIGPPMAASPLQTGPERCFPYVTFRECQDEAS
ncbi:hypothetical protein NOF04DRAFT_1327762 [Fusarium oxysporum II5]|nr:hypothetical protein NOF04DRAFT_1327762 [Fusarium oxysporum II5]